MKTKIIEALRAEVRWHVKNPQKGILTLEELAFIRGLKQAIFIIKALLK